MATMRAVAESPHAGRQLAYAALVNAGHCLTEAGRPVGEALKEYRDAMQLDPLRWEAPFHIAIRLLAGRDPECARALLEDRIRMGYADEGLYWKEHDVYEWRLAYELCLLRAVTGSADEAERLGESLLKADRLPLMESGFIRKLLERLESRKPDPSADLDEILQPGPP
jgi:hypothetical protein